MGAEAALGQGKPAGGLVTPEGRQFDVAEAWLRIKLDEILLVLFSHDKNLQTQLISNEQFSLIIIPANYSRKLDGQE